MALADTEIEQASEFLRGNLESYEQIEILQLMAASRDRSWTASAIAQELGIGAGEAARALDHLCARNLLDVRIVGELHFRYGPGSEELESRCEAFLRTLSKNPVALARLMADHQREHRQSGVLRAFVDAFLLRGPDKDG